MSGEQELLAYLPTRLANVELAQRCYVSVNTIKTHVSHIYRKLGVQGRSAAVTRAVELGLLPETAVELHPTGREAQAGSIRSTPGVSPAGRSSTTRSVRARSSTADTKIPNRSRSGDIAETVTRWLPVSHV